MVSQIVINFLIMLAWMFLFNSYTVANAIFGYIIGGIIVRILIRLMGQDFYLRRVIAFIKLIGIFIRELLIANFKMILLLIKPKIGLKTGIIEIPTKLESAAEQTIFSVMMILIPGTMPLEFSKDNKYVYVHSLFAEDKEKIMKSIQKNYEEAIMEVTRSRDV